MWMMVRSAESTMRVAVVSHLQIVALSFSLDPTPSPALNLSTCFIFPICPDDEPSFDFGRVSFVSNNPFFCDDKLFSASDRPFFPADKVFYGIYWLFLATYTAFCADFSLFFQQNRLFCPANITFWRPYALKNHTKPVVYAEMNRK